MPTEGYGNFGLDGASELWRGEPFADFADEEWARQERARLNELRLVALEHRYAAALTVGDVHATVPALEVLAAQHPLREGVWQLLALALYRTGRQAEALQALRVARETLRDELGLDPSPALRELEAAILEQSPSIGASGGIILIASPSRLPAATQPVGTPRAPSAEPAFDSVVGRDQQLAELRRAGDRADAGRLQTVVVSGEAGIGKTWLVEAFADRLAQEGWEVAWGRCHETSGAPALWPWLQVLGELEQAHPLPGDIRELVSGTRDPATTAENGAGDARFRQHDSIRRYLGSVAASRPLLIALDDLQWADIASLQLLADVLTVTRTARILAVVTTRGGDDADRFRQQALVRLDRAGALRLTLAGLDVAALDELAGAAGLEVSGEELLERTGGNPLFAREHLRLAHRGDSASDQTRVPDSVGDLIRQRLSGLSEPTRSALHAASVLGRDIDVDALVAISEESDAEIWDAMDAGVLAGVLTQTSSGDWRFRHDLVRETLYADLSSSRRARLHARALAALERRPVVDVSQLAQHAQASGSLARSAATRWSIAAAREAAARLAYEDSARWWTRAVAAHARDAGADPAARSELLMALLGAQLNAGDAIGARDTRNQAVLAAAEYGDATAAAWALVALDAPALWLLRQFDEVEFGIIGRLEQALANLPEADDVLRCRVLAALASELYGPGRDPRCDSLSAEAVAMARRLGDPAVLVVALNARYLAMNREMIPDECVEIGHELVGLGDARGWAAVRLLGHLMLASSLIYRGDVAGADEHAAQAERLNRRLNLPLPRMQALGYRLARLQLDGRFDESAAGIEEFSELRLSWWAFDGLLASMRVTQLFLAERLEQATEPMLATAALARPSLAHDCRVLIDAGAGRLPGTPPRWPAPARDWAWLAMTLVRAEAVSIAGDEAIRRRTYADLVAYAGKLSYSSGFAAPVDWYLARLARCLGDATAARRHLDSLQAICVRESLDWWAGRARTEALAAS
jgi:hypothetical protein